MELFRAIKSTIKKEPEKDKRCWSSKSNGFLIKVSVIVNGTAEHVVLKKSVCFPSL